MDKTAARHLAAIEAGEVTKSNIIGIRKILNHVARIRNGYSGNRSNATPADADSLCAAIWQHRPRIAGEMHESGLKLLRSKRYAKRLAPVADIIAALDHFELVAFPHYDSGYFYTAPIYRAVAMDGRGFNFRNLPWQAVAYNERDGLTSGPVIMPESCANLESGK